MPRSERMIVILSCGVWVVTCKNMIGQGGGGDVVGSTGRWCVFDFVPPSGGVLGPVLNWGATVTQSKSATWIVKKIFV